MKVVPLKQTKNRHPELDSGSLSNCNDLADSKQILKHPPAGEAGVQDDDMGEDPWQYQGKRRDQLEGSYKIFVLCLAAFAVIALLTLLFI